MAEILRNTQNFGRNSEEKIGHWSLWFRYYDIDMANTAFPLANTTSFRILETIWIEMVHVWIKKYGKFKVMQAEHFVERLDANRPNFD